MLLVFPVPPSLLLSSSDGNSHCRPHTLDRRRDSGHRLQNYRPGIRRRIDQIKCTENRLNYLGRNDDNDLSSRDTADCDDCDFESDNRRRYGLDARDDLRGIYTRKLDEG